MERPAVELDYEGHIRRCRQLVIEMKNYASESVRRIWLIGRELAQIATKYGEATLVRAAKDLGYSKTTIYRWRALYLKLPNEKDFEAALAVLSKPSFAALAREIGLHPAKNPELFGGPEEVQEKLAMDVEELGQRVEEYEEIFGRDGLVERAEQVIEESAKTQAALRRPTQVFSEDNFDIDRDPAYRSFVESLPCYFCGRNENVRPLTVAKDSDYWSVPICGGDFNKLYEGQFNREELLKGVIDTLVKYILYLKERRLQWAGS